MSDNLSSQRQLRFSELIRSLISECLLVEDFYNFSVETTSITILGSHVDCANNTIS